MTLLKKDRIKKILEKFKNDEIDFEGAFKDINSVMKKSKRKVIKEIEHLESNSDHGNQGDYGSVIGSGLNWANREY